MGAKEPYNPKMIDNIANGYIWEIFHFSKLMVLFIVISINNQICYFKNPFNLFAERNLLKLYSLFGLKLY